MKFLERDLEEILFTADKSALFDQGFYKASNLKRQLVIGRYGRADMVGFECRSKSNQWHIPGKRFIVTVYELKQDKISVSSFLQAAGYLRGIKDYLKKKHPHIYDNTCFEIVLVGRNVDDNSSFIYLPYLLEGEKFRLSLFTYEYDVYGIKFKTHKHYSLLNSGF